MSDRDSELDELMARRLAEMQKNIEGKKNPEEEQKEPGPRDIVLSRLGYRGAEVLQNAERQFPQETRLVVAKLAQMIRTGEITHVIDGGQLLGLFRAIGMMVRMDNKIQIVKDGKTSSISGRLKEIRGDEIS